MAITTEQTEIQLKITLPTALLKELEATIPAEQRDQFLPTCSSENYAAEISGEPGTEPPERGQTKTTLNWLNRTALKNTCAEFVKPGCPTVGMKLSKTTAFSPSNEFVGCYKKRV